MRTHPGNPLLLGATYKGGSVWNFAVFSPNKITDLAIADFETQSEIARFPLRDKLHRNGHIWHIEIEGLPKQFLWAWHVHTTRGVRLAVDPYAKLIYSGATWGSNRWDLAKKTQADLFFAVESEPTHYRWASSPLHPMNPTDHIIYETHVRAMTKDPSSKVSSPGTWNGFIEKLDYLVDLGITAIELLPIYEWNENEWPRTSPSTGEVLYNFWGYSPLNFFSPMQRFSSFEDPILASLELKKFIDECHKRKLHVLLDVVYNHTGEGNEQGPSYSWKLLSEPSYYIMDSKELHTNYSGCGNTFNTNHPITRRLIIESLKHWVYEYRIDGFRFDLAGTFFRDVHGKELSFSPILQSIAMEPLLCSKLLITEPWDAGGMYKTGSLYKEQLSKKPPLFEWNDRFRDDVRRFIKGDFMQKGLFASRLAGSEDIYQNPQKTVHSVNYITSHDGFSLHDLVSYNVKHNFENAENNRDGSSDNCSCNYGQEGPTNDPMIENVRQAQMRNFLLALFLSHGIPMLHQGDEYGHTKQGNNNSWCQDNQINWFLWNKLEANKSLTHFVKQCIQLRENSPMLRSSSFFKNSEIDWHGQTPFEPQWNSDEKYLGFTTKTRDGTPEYYVGFCASTNATLVTLPSYNLGHWTPILWSNEKPLPLHEKEKTNSFQKIYVGPCSSFVFVWNI